MKWVSQWVWFIIIVNGIIGLMPCFVMANDMAFGGAGADLIPLTENRVQMVSENIFIERLAPSGYEILGEGSWHISATYHFRNLTGEPINIQIGFPEPACPEESDCNFSGFESMITTVRGVAVELTVGTVEPQHIWAENIGQVHLFTVGFAPNETVEVVHNYHHSLSEHINGGEDLTYLTRTGSQWAESIENARFRVRLPFRPWGLSLGEWDSQLVSLTEQMINGKPQTELSFQWTNWEPKQDLEFYIGPGRPTLETPSLVADCPAHSELFEFDIDVAALDITDLKDRTRTLSKDQLRICRNAIFAHHGKDFDDSDLDQFFYGEQDLQIHTHDASDNSAIFAKNQHFSLDLLTDSEMAYIKTIQQVELNR